MGQRGRDSKWSERKEDVAEVGKAIRTAFQVPKSREERARNRSPFGEASAAWMLRQKLRAKGVVRRGGEGGQTQSKGDGGAGG